MDQEIDRENITPIMKAFHTETENINQQMQSIMKANGQAESFTDDDRSSAGSYKGKSSKIGKHTTYCSCKPDHNVSKCKSIYTPFCDFCKKREHSAKARRYEMNRHNMCVHCRLHHANEPCQQSCQNKREDLRNSPSTTTGAPRTQRHHLIPQGTQSTLPRPCGFDVYPPLENIRPTCFIFKPTGMNEYWKIIPYGHQSGKPHLQLNLFPIFLFCFFCVWLCFPSVSLFIFLNLSS